MFGCTEAQLATAVKQQCFPGEELMFAAGILSDAQEAMSGEFGEPDVETARQYINRAKHIMFSLMKDERETA
jgi:hypothetical protein